MFSTCIFYCGRKMSTLQTHDWIFPDPLSTTVDKPRRGNSADEFFPPITDKLDDRGQPISVEDSGLLGGGGTLVAESDESGKNIFLSSIFYISPFHATFLSQYPLFLNGNGNSIYFFLNTQKAGMRIRFGQKQDPGLCR